MTADRVDVSPSVLWMAQRYALGRATYVSAEMREEIVRVAPKLSVHQARRMAQEISDAFATDAAGMDCDVREWAQARDALLRRTGDLS